MHLLQGRFPALAAVSGNMVARWAHANEVPARPRRGVLHLATPDTDVGLYIIELAKKSRYTWDTIAAELVVRHRARAPQLSECSHLTHPFSPCLSHSRARSLSLSLQERFPELGAVSEETVRVWAHANGVAARPRVRLLHDVTPGTEEGRFIIDLHDHGMAAPAIAQRFAVSTHVRLPFSRLVVTTPLTLRACLLLAGSVRRV